MREVKEDTLVLERGDGTHEHVSRDRVVLVPTVDIPSNIPDASSTTTPHGVSVPLQLSHPDRGLAELPPPNDGDQSRPSCVYTRLTSKRDRLSNPVNRAARD